MKKLFAFLLICGACLAAGEPTPTPTPSPSPTQAVVAPWLIPGTTDPAYPFGSNPKTTFIFVSKYEVVSTPFGDGVMLTFRPKFEPSP